ncbi:MAG: STAS domain-containing protein [Leptospiraceae bacterium]|nr:STAS domain-containing protein [Leptospiraceae bacterium]
MFSISVQSENASFQEIVLEAKGVLDSSSHIDFYDFIKEEEAKGFSKFILDFSGLESISSAGIAVLIRIRKKFKEKNYTLVCIELNPEIKELFYFFGFQKLFLLAEDKEAAEKLLESLYFLQRNPESQKSVSEEKFSEKPKFRFGFDEEESIVKNPSIKDYSEKKEDPKIFQREINKLKNVAEEKVPLAEKIQEIKTEPFFETSTQKKSSGGFTIPFVTKSFGYDLKDTARESIVEQEMDSFSEEFNELVINCGTCGTRIKIKKQGIQKCPTCFSRFNLRQSGSISTIEKL